MASPGATVRFGQALLRTIGAVAGVLAVVCLGLLGLMALFFDAFGSATCDYDDLTDDCRNGSGPAIAYAAVAMLLGLVGLLAVPLWLARRLHLARTRRAEALAAPREINLQDWFVHGRVAEPLYSDLLARVRRWRDGLHEGETSRAAGQAVSGFGVVLSLVAVVGLLPAAVFTLDEGYCADVPDSCTLARVVGGIAMVLLVVGVILLASGIAVSIRGRVRSTLFLQRLQADLDAVARAAHERKLPVRQTKVVDTTSSA